MNDAGRSQGYVTDTSYADKFFRELSPVWLNYVAAVERGHARASSIGHSRISNSAAASAIRRSSMRPPSRMASSTPATSIRLISRGVYGTRPPSAFPMFSFTSLRSISCFRWTCRPLISSCCTASTVGLVPRRGRPSGASSAQRSSRAAWCMSVTTVCLAGRPKRRCAGCCWSSQRRPRAQRLNARRRRCRFEAVERQQVALFHCQSVRRHGSRFLCPWIQQLPRP